MTPEPFYDHAADFYDRMIPWAKRLQNERPAFEAMWEAWRPGRVLDAACGTGAHLELLATLPPQAQLTGSDASAQMITQARGRLDAAIDLVCSPWDQLPSILPPAPFDLVLCLGNSLPYVLEEEALRGSLAGLRSTVAPGGRLLIQFKNFALMRERGECYLPLVVSPARDDAPEQIYIRQYQWWPARVDFTIIQLEKQPGGGWTQRHLTTPLATWEPEQVASHLEALGLNVTLHGSLALEPFDPAQSPDAILLARAPLH